MGTPVDIPSEVTKVTGRLLLVNRGDGNLFKLRESQIPGFLAKNPHAFVLGKKSVAAPSVAESSALEDMTNEELRALADEKGVHLPAAVRTKKAIIYTLRVSGVEG